LAKAEDDELDTISPLPFQGFSEGENRIRRESGETSFSYSFSLPKQSGVEMVSLDHVHHTAYMTSSMSHRAEIAKVLA
jgi:hypothetical protein